MIIVVARHITCKMSQRILLFAIFATHKFVKSHYITKRERTYFPQGFYAMLFSLQNFAPQCLRAMTILRPFS